MAQRGSAACCTGPTTSPLPDHLLHHAQHVICLQVMCEGACDLAVGTLGWSTGRGAACKAGGMARKQGMQVRKAR